MTYETWAKLQNSEAQKEGLTTAVMDRDEIIKQLLARVKAEQDYTRAVISERDAFCTEADVLRMQATALVNLGVCDECGTPYSFDPTDGGSICVRCLLEKNDRLLGERDELKALMHKALDERDAFCTEADVLRMSLTALQSERDRLRKAAQMAPEAIEALCYSNTTHAADVISSNAADALRKELGHE